jgi:general secretion pathway protein A
MYEAHFGLKEKPFSILPDPSFLYLGRKHQMAFTLLEYAIENQAGFAVITGEVGCGKTTLIRHLLNRLSGDITVGMITNTHESFGQLLQWILHAFGLDYGNSRSKVTLYRIFTDFLIAEYAKGRRTLLIIDEAQNLSLAILEELRMLSNINADKDQVLQMILSGQPELKEKLKRQELRQFAQRVAVDYELLPLDAEETAHYVTTRLQIAGRDAPLFTPEAIELLHRHTQGIPRRINILCDMALVYGYAGQQQQIDAELLEEVIGDKARTGIFTDPVPLLGDVVPDADEAPSGAGPTRSSTSRACGICLEKTDSGFLLMSATVFDDQREKSNAWK